MKKLLLTLALCLLPTLAYAQGNPTCPDRPASSNDNSCANTRWVKANGGGGGAPAGNAGDVQYNNSGSFGGYTNTQLTALINPFTSSLPGATPASGGGTSNFLRADGTWTAPPTGTLPTIASGHMIANATAGSTPADDTTATSWFDRWACSTVSFVLGRTNSAWACINIPATPQMFDASCGTAAHDCTAALQSCVNTTICYLPAGSYGLTSTVTLADQAGVHVTLYGQGGASIIYVQTAAAGTNALKVTSPGTTIHDLAITYQSQGTGPGGTAPTTGGIGILSQQAGANYLTTYYNLTITKAYIGIMTAGPGFVAGGGIGEVYRDIFVFDATYAGYFVYQSGPYLFQNINTSSTGLALMSKASLYVLGTTGLVVNQGELFGSVGYCALILSDGTPTGHLEASLVTQVYFDTCKLGVYTDSMSNSTWNGNWFSGSGDASFGGSTAPMLTVTGTSTHLQFNNNIFHAAGGQGAYVSGGTFISFIGNQFLSNGINTPSAGLQINAGNSWFTVVGNISTGNYYGIYLNAGNSNLSVQNNLLGGNTTAIVNLAAACNCQTNPY